MGSKKEKKESVGISLTGSSYDGCLIKRQECRQPTYFVSYNRNKINTKQKTKKHGMQTTSRGPHDTPNRQSAQQTTHTRSLSHTRTLARAYEYSTQHGMGGRRQRLLTVDASVSLCASFLIARPVQNHSMPAPAIAARIRAKPPLLQKQNKT